MGRLKTYEEFIKDIDSSDEIENDMMAMGEPTEAGDGEEVVSTDQTGADAEIDVDAVDGEEAGKEAEELEGPESEGEQDMKIDGEVVDTEPKNLEDEVEEDKIPGGLSDGMSLEDLAIKHGVDVAEIEAAVEAEHTDDEEVALEIAKDHIFEDPKYYDKLEATVEEAEEVEAEEEDAEEVEAEVEDAEEVEAEEEDSEEAEEEAEEEDSEEVVLTVAEMMKEMYEACKSEAKVWEEDMHDDHTLESYMRENAALAASLSTEALKEMKEDMTIEMYEAMCEGLKESYSKKIDEMKEAYGAEGSADAE